MNRKPPAPKIRRIITTKRTPPATVPDANRPLSDKGQPGGNPPAGIQPGWSTLRGSGSKYHTHS